MWHCCRVPGWLTIRPTRKENQVTGTTPEARAHARELRRKSVANNQARRCPKHHRHGETGTCYSGHGCRCGDCTRARAAVKRREYYGIRSITRQDMKVSSLGAMRRLQALAYMGWSCSVVAEKIGTHYRVVNRLREGGREHVMRSTHEVVDGVFRELAMVEAPGHSGRITRSHARSRGWVPAVAWDAIDDPRERPKGFRRAARV